MGTLLPVLAVVPGLQGPVGLAKHPAFSVAASLCGVSLYPCKSRSVPKPRIPSRRLPNWLSPNLLCILNLEF